MGAGLVAVGAGASLLQSGIGAFQAYNAKQAQDKAYRDLQNMPKPENAYANVRIGNEAYAAQEAKNSQTEANLVQSLQDMGTTAALGGIPVVQQQADIANADITAKKAAELQRLEVAKAEQQQKINDDYLNYKRQLGMMQLQGAGAARAQGMQSLFAGIGGLTSIAGGALSNKNISPNFWGGLFGNTGTGDLTAPDYTQQLGGNL